MDFQIIAVTVRSVTIEWDSDTCWRMPEKHEVFLNGVRAAETDQNVFSLYGLQPETEYQIEADGVSHTFMTRRESVLLDVRRFGAAGDGMKDDTAALQAAIAACPPEGTVRIPAGIYRASPLFLKSSMTLLLEKDAVLLGETDRRRIPVLPGLVRCGEKEDEYNFATWEGDPQDSFASLITAIDVENLDLIGEGTLDGNAQNGDWWVRPKEKRIAWRPNTLFLERCRNIRVQGLRIIHSPSWTVHPYYSDNLQFLNLDIQNPPDSPNTDGFDPESCRNVLLLGTCISVGDDCIAIKSGKIYMAQNHPRGSEGIVIRNCLLSRGHGSVTIGSETAGGVRNVRVSQCLFDSTDRGIRIKTRRGRGKASVLDDLQFENIVMRDTPMAVTVNMFYFCDADGHSNYVQSQEWMPADDRTPAIGTIRISRVACTGADACFLCAFGLPEAPVGEIDVSDVRASFRPTAERTPQCPIMMDHFPELSGEAFYLRNIRKVRLKNIAVTGAGSDQPVLRDIGDSRFENVQIEREQAAPAFA